MTEKLNHPAYETKFTWIAYRYIRTYFVLEFLACVPIFTFEAIYGFTVNYEEVKEHHIDSTLYHIFFYFKLFKLFSVPKIVQTFNTVVKQVKDYFYMKTRQIESAN